MPRLSKQRIAAILQEEIDNSDLVNGSSLAENMRQATRYFIGRPRGDELPGRSNVQSLDVADMHRHMMSQISQSFASDVLAEFEAEGPDDVDSAALESMAVNKMIMETNRGYVLLNDAVHQALLFKNGTLAAEVVETERAVSERFEPGADLAAIAAQLSSDEVTAEIEDDTVRVTTKVKALQIRVVDSPNFLVSEEHNSVFLEDVRFVAERILLTRSELLERDVSRETVDKLPTHVAGRGLDADEMKVDGDVTTLRAATRDQDLIECFVCFLLISLDESGISERRRYLFADGHILEDDPGEIDFASGSAFPMPGRFPGLSIFDLLKEVQDNKTGLLRGIQNNISVNNFGEVIAGPTADADDLLNRRHGGILNADNTEDVVPFKYNDTVPSALQALEYFDKVRSDRAGASIDLGSSESQLLNSQIGSMGADRIMSSQEQMVAYATRNLSETMIRSLYLLVHRKMRELDGPIMLKVRDEWVPVDPRKFRTRTRVNIKTGLSPGERNRRTNALANTMSFQQQAFQAGLNDVLVDLKGLHTGYVDWAKSQGLDNADKYVLDPSSQAAQQAGQQKAEQEQQSAEQQQQLVQAQIQVLQLAEQVKLQIAQLDNDTKKQIEVLKAEVEEAKIIAQATTEIELAGIDSEQSATLASRQTNTEAGRTN